MNIARSFTASTPSIAVLVSTCLIVVGLIPLVAQAESGQLAMSSQAQYSTVIQGALDPVSADIYNTAPAGDDPVDFSVFASFPYGNSSTFSGSRAADGGSGYLTLPFTFNTALVTPGSNTISVTARDNGTGGTLTQAETVNVLAHAVPAFVVGGNIMPLESQPPAAQEPSVDPLAFGATGGGETFAARSSAVNDPIYPTAGLDVDSISSFGSPQITLTLAPFSDLAADDDPAHGMQFDVDVDGSVPGHYFTTFELNYSDEDLPGAYAAGSEHGFFSVEVDVTESGVTGGIVVPEPGALTLMMVGVGIAWAMRKSRF